jgi:murein DD-endopeptidase MepM/ murein hydrolase activator NlpD
LFAVLIATALLPGAAAAHPAMPNVDAAVASRTPAASPGRFRPPVDGEVIDGWRPPATRYGPGNRGWEYATTVGESVRAAGDGTVAFAGQVGGTLHVTVAHRGGLRTTYSLLATVEVTVGGTVRAGDRLGTAGERLHFGARLASGYIDPGLLFRPGALRLGARLLPSARAHAGLPVRSATITRRFALGQAICTGRTSAGRSRKKPRTGSSHGRHARRARDVQPMGRRRQWPLSA